MSEVLERAAARAGRIAALVALSAVLGVVAQSALFGVPAWAQMESREAIALQNQILELRRDLQVLGSQQGRPAAGGAVGPYQLAPPSSGGSALGRAAPPAPPGAGGDLLPQLLDRVSALEEQVRTLRGRVDEIGNNADQQKRDFSKQIGDLSFRLQSLEGGRGGGGAQVPPPTPVSPGPPPSAPPPSAEGNQAPRRPETAIQEGNAALGRRDYAAAESAAREVLNNNRTSPRAYDAQFLLANALAGRQNWAQAAIAYDDVYNRSRTGSHAQDALLGLAHSLIGLGDKRAGCGALTKLQSEFPKPRPEIREQVVAARQRAGCP